MKVLIIVVAFALIVACGSTEGAAQAVDTPEWTENDAKLALKDYLESIVPHPGYLYLDDAYLWSVNYEGDGWWRIEGEHLGWGMVAVTPTPIPTPEPIHSSGTRFLSGPAREEMYQQDLADWEAHMALAPEHIDIPSFVKGVWLVSERTEEVKRADSTAESMFGCVTGVGGC